MAQKRGRGNKRGTRQNRERNAKAEGIVHNSPVPTPRGTARSLLNPAEIFGRGWAGQDNTAVAEMGVLNVEMAFNGPQGRSQQHHLAGPDGRVYLLSLLPRTLMGRLRGRPATALIPRALLPFFHFPFFKHDRLSRHVSLLGRSQPRWESEFVRVDR